jgi:hypothetical protein
MGSKNLCLDKVNGFPFILNSGVSLIGDDFHESRDNNSDIKEDSSSGGH